MDNKDPKALKKMTVKIEGAEQAGTKRVKLEPELEEEQKEKERLVKTQDSEDRHANPKSEKYNDSSASCGIEKVGSSSSVEGSSLSSTTTKDVPLGPEIDTRHRHRHGWPLLPTLPLRTVRSQIPKNLSSTSSPHLPCFRSILQNNKITVQELEIAHRFNAGTPIDKSTLTLCIHSSISCKDKWEDAIQSLRTYITSQSPPLTLAVEMIDSRIFNGVYTLPILSYDPLSTFVARRRHGLVSVLNGCGEAWTSLEFYYRGVGNTRNDCRATVLIGVPEPGRKVWWEDVVPIVREKVAGRLEVEVCWREVSKY
ncbi:hypothetical protein EJ02DRAFT_457228 [Clathrospora elynae]|uniref:Uncharacterized protein n=1 Tax=Clathrospora elynae TaxID=706981 RepID=A0A6A5SH46_9PLEO|nr:hypothetical protein EJ02DRAFT_457228 [Clathrospora elynae]